MKLERAKNILILPNMLFNESMSIKDFSETLSKELVNRFKDCDNFELKIKTPIQKQIFKKIVEQGFQYDDPEEKTINWVDKNDKNNENNVKKIKIEPQFDDYKLILNKYREAQLQLVRDAKLAEFLSKILLDNQDDQNDQILNLAQQLKDLLLAPALNYAQIKSSIDELAKLTNDKDSIKTIDHTCFDACLIRVDFNIQLFISQLDQENQKIYNDRIEHIKNSESCYTNPYLNKNLHNLSRAYTIRHITESGQKIKLIIFPSEKWNGDLCIMADYTQNSDLNLFNQKPSTEMANGGSFKKALHKNTIQWDLNDKQEVIKVKQMVIVEKFDPQRDYGHMFSKKYVDDAQMIMPIPLATITTSKTSRGYVKMYTRPNPKFKIKALVDKIVANEKPFVKFVAQGAAMLPMAKAIKHGLTELQKMSEKIFTSAENINALIDEINEMMNAIPLDPITLFRQVVAKKCNDDYKEIIKFYKKNQLSSKVLESYTLKNFIERSGDVKKSQESLNIVLQLCLNKDFITNITTIMADNKRFISQDNKEWSEYKSPDKPTSLINEGYKPLAINKKNIFYCSSQKLGNAILEQEQITEEDFEILQYLYEPHLNQIKYDENGDWCVLVKNEILELVDDRSSAKVLWVIPYKGETVKPSMNMLTTLPNQKKMVGEFLKNFPKTNEYGIYVDDNENKIFDIKFDNSIYSPLTGSIEIIDTIEFEHTTTWASKEEEILNIKNNIIEFTQNNLRDSASHYFKKQNDNQEINSMLKIQQYSEILHYFVRLLRYEVIAEKGIIGQNETVELIGENSELKNKLTEFFNSTMSNVINQKDINLIESIKDFVQKI